MSGKGLDFSIIRTIRKKYGLTVEELAQKAHLTRMTVSKIETAKGNPTMETIEALARVFQLAPSELIRMVEKNQAEPATITDSRCGDVVGKRIAFPNFEILHLRGQKGDRTEFDPGLHENTAEICFVLQGKLVLTVSGQSFELQAGMALRFKAMQEHQITIVENAEFLLMHHLLV